MIETHKGIVYPWQCDHMGHLNVAHYVGKFDEATWALFALAGLDARHFREHARGMAALEQHLTYTREVLAGEVVVVRSGVLDAGGKVMKFRHEMFVQAGDLAATCVLTAIYMDTVARKSAVFPPEIKQNLATLIQQPAPETLDESQ